MNIGWETKEYPSRFSASFVWSAWVGGVTLFLNVTRYHVQCILTAWERIRRERALDDTTCKGGGEMANLRPKHPLTMSEAEKVYRPV